MWGWGGNVREGNRYFPMEQGDALKTRLNSKISVWNKAWKVELHSKEGGRKRQRYCDNGPKKAKKRKKRIRQRTEKIKYIGIRWDQISEEGDLFLLQSICLQLSN